MSNLSELQRLSESFRAQRRNDLWEAVIEASELLRQIAPRKRVNFKKMTKQRMYDAQSGVCAICGGLLEEEQRHVDHIIPFGYGGGNETSNLQLAHKSCNLEKGDQVDPVDLLRYLESEVRNLPSSKQVVYLGRALDNFDEG